MEDKEYSTKFALKQLEPIISKLKIEMDDLGSAIKASDKPDNAMVIAYSQKKALYNILIGRQKKLNELNASYGLAQNIEKKRMTRRDQALRDLDSKIETKAANIISSDSRNENVLRGERKFNNQMHRLKMKRARMLVRQRKAVNRKLAKEIKHFDRKGKLYGLLEARATLERMHTDNLNMHVDRANELAASNNLIDKTFRTAKERISVASSWMRFQSMKAYTAILKKKQGLLVGAKSAKQIESAYRGRPR